MGLTARLPLCGAESLQQSRVLQHAGPGPHLPIELAIAAVIEPRAPIDPDDVLRIGGWDRRPILAHSLEFLHPDLGSAAIFGEKRRHSCNYYEKENNGDGRREAITRSATPCRSRDFDGFSHSGQKGVVPRPGASGLPACCLSQVDFTTANAGACSAVAGLLSPYSGRSRGPPKEMGVYAWTVVPFFGMPSEA